MRNESINWKNLYYAYSQIEEFMCENNIQRTFNPIKYCKDKGWHLIPYPENNFNEFYKISKDGFSLCEENEYFIFYNPYHVDGRINFTIAHEIGHIYYLHHFLVPEKILLSSNNNNIWEKQANIFARNILMPPLECKTLVDKGYNLAKYYNFFGVSKQAMAVRRDLLHEDLRMFRISRDKFKSI